MQLIAYPKKMVSTDMQKAACIFFPSIFSLIQFILALYYEGSEKKVTNNYLTLIQLEVL